MSADLLFDVYGVEPLAADVAADMVVRYHYLHRRPSISHGFGLWDAGTLVGVCTYGIPASRHVQMSVCPTDPNSTIELNRLWCADRMPRNTESRFVAETLRRLPPLLVFSYADTAAGHVGYIYRALNFHYAGLTDADRVTPRGDWVPATSPDLHSRAASRVGRVPGALIRRKPKHRYWTATGNRSDRRRLTALCGWPSLSWGDR